MLNYVFIHANTASIARILAESLKVAADKSPAARARAQVAQWHDNC